VPASVRDSGYPVVSVPYAPAPRAQRLPRPALWVYDRTIRKIWNAWRRIVAPRDLARVVVSTRADIVQSVDLPALRCASLAAGRMRSILAFDSHEMWTGFLDNPELGMRPFDRFSLLRMERKYAPLADVVFVVSDEMGRRMAEHYRLKSVLTVFNSPPGHAVRSRPTGSPVRLVFHGSLAATKNVEGLILAMTHLKGKATLDVHGAALTVLEEHLRDLIRDNDLVETVRIHGSFGYADVLSLLSSYDVGVYAAKRIEENFAISLPNKLFDCICAGLAVAMSDLPAICDVIQESGCGVCLDPSSPETIADGLDRLVDDPAAIDRMKARALAAAPVYEWNAQAEKIVDVFQELLA